MNCVLLTLTCWFTCTNGNIHASQKLSPAECRQMEMKMDKEKRRQELKDMLELEKLRKENNEPTK